MECPYCKNTMTSGIVFGERGDLIWYTDKEAQPPYILKFFGFGGETISKQKYISPIIKGDKCNRCNKIIIDLNNK